MLKARCQLMEDRRLWKDKDELDSPLDAWPRQFSLKQDILLTSHNPTHRARSYFRHPLNETKQCENNYSQHSSSHSNWAAPWSGRVGSGDAPFLLSTTRGDGQVSSETPGGAVWRQQSDDEKCSDTWPASATVM